MSRITDLYAKGRAALARSEASQYEAVCAMAELVRLGQSQREIAAGLGCSQKTVSRYLSAFSESRDSEIPEAAFAERLAAVYKEARQPTVPDAPDQKAALAARLLEDKAVADAPQVRKVQERHTDRRFKEQARVFNRDHGIPTATDKRNEGRRTSVIINVANWFTFRHHVKTMARELGDFTGELERTGLPSEDSGDTIRAVRALGRACDRFVQAATDRAIGRSS
jgi:transcriptional regulator with XRE-family HTH domain